MRWEEVLDPRLDGPSVEDIIKARVVPEDAAIMLEYAGRARERFAALGAACLPAMVTHGDLIGGNVLYSRGALSGVIDFDFTHLDLRVADFVWTWRGTYDDFVRGYEEVTPLTATERALLAPAYWVTVLDSVRMELLWSDSTAPVPLPGTIRYLRALVRADRRRDTVSGALPARGTVGTWPGRPRSTLCRGRSWSGGPPEEDACARAPPLGDRRQGAWKARATRPRRRDPGGCRPGPVRGVFWGTPPAALSRPPG